MLLQTFLLRNLLKKKEEEDEDERAELLKKVFDVVMC
jgi:hypothetical protein